MPGASTRHARGAPTLREALEIALVSGEGPLGEQG
jgi:hypothetical protein